MPMMVTVVLRRGRCVSVIGSSLVTLALAFGFLGSSLLTLSGFVQIAFRAELFAFLCCPLLCKPAGTIVSDMVRLCTSVANNIFNKLHRGGRKLGANTGHADLWIKILHG